MNRRGIQTTTDGTAAPTEADREEYRRIGSPTGMKIYGWMLRWVPRPLMYFFALIPVVYYYLKRHEVRLSSPIYQRHLGLKHGWWKAFRFGFRQAAVYSRIILDNMYLGAFGPDRFRIEYEGTERFMEALGRGKGLILLSAHLGNWHLAINFLGRTGAAAHLVTEDVRSPEVKRHMDAAKKKAIHLTIHDAREGMNLVFKLKAALRNGDVVVLSGDRIHGGRNVRARFLGEEANFPLLGFALSRASGAPICVGMAFSTGMQQYEFHGIGPINDEVERDLPAKQEHSRLAQIFADHLGSHLERFPLQWFNFYDFWAK